MTDAALKYFILFVDIIRPGSLWWYSPPRHFRCDWWYGWVQNICEIHSIKRTER